MATKESQQKKLGRVRPPRVHITYDVETGGAIEKRDIPFVVGVLADLSGQPSKPLPKLKDRKFTEIDRDNFDQVMAKQEPRLAFKVDNKLTEEGGKMGVELKFGKLGRFRARQCSPPGGALEPVAGIADEIVEPAEQPLRERQAGGVAARGDREDRIRASRIRHPGRLTMPPKKNPNRRAN